MYTCNNTDFHLKPVILFKFQLDGHVCNLYNIDVRHDKYNNVICILNTIMLYAYNYSFLIILSNMYNTPF